jgi:hypothetical protein
MLPYEEKPKPQKGVAYTCMCPDDIKKPLKKNLGGFMGEDYIGSSVAWCGLCGNILSMKDHDKYFPTEEWRDNR